MHMRTHTVCVWTNVHNEDDQCKVNRNANAAFGRLFLLAESRDSKRPAPAQQG